MFLKIKPLVAMLGVIGFVVSGVTQAAPGAATDTVSAATAQAPAQTPAPAQAQGQGQVQGQAQAQAPAPDTTSSATQAPASAPASASAPVESGPGPVVGFTPAGESADQAAPAPSESPEAQLAQRLDITPAQMPLWTAYMQAKAQLDEPVKLTFKAPQSVQEALEQRLAVQEARLLPQQRLVAARAQLINAMTPAQRFALDMFETGRGIGPVIITPDMPAWHILHP